MKNLCAHQLGRSGCPGVQVNFARLNFSSSAKIVFNGCFEVCPFDSLACGRLSAGWQLDRSTNAGYFGNFAVLAKEEERTSQLQNQLEHVSETLHDIADICGWYGEARSPRRSHMCFKKRYNQNPTSSLSRLKRKNIHMRKENP